MEYNTSREMLVIPEYGRNIQKMINHAIKINDRELRNQAAKTIVGVMSQVNPLKDCQETQNKYWNHLIIISDYKLDVDSPFDLPIKEVIEAKPEPMAYLDGEVAFKHYGRNIEKIALEAVKIEDEDKRNALIVQLANHMKRTYMTWNNGTISDEVVFEHLKILSGGELIVPEGVRLGMFKDVIIGNVTTNQRPKKKKKNIQQRNNKSFQNRR